MIGIKTKVISLAMVAVGVVAPSLAQAAWPDGKQVYITVPYPPGTEPDILARELGMILGEERGANFVVENRPGANSIIGTDRVARSEGDGDQLLMVDTLAIATNPLLYKKLPYDWEKTLKPVVTVAGTHLYLLVNDKLPVKNYQEFIERAKASKGELNISTGSRGHVTHLGMGRLAKEEGVEFTYIPYSGVAPAVNGLLAGETDAMLVGGMIASKQATGGKVRILAVGASERSELLSEIPTIAESGGPADSVPTTTFTLFAPATTSDATVMEIHRAVTKAVQAPKIKESFKARGLISVDNTPEEIRASIERNIQVYTELMPTLGIKPE